MLIIHEINANSNTVEVLNLGEAADHVARVTAYLGSLTYGLEVDRLQPIAEEKRQLYVQLKSNGRYDRGKELFAPDAPKLAANALLGALIEDRVDDRETAADDLARLDPPYVPENGNDFFLTTRDGIFCDTDFEPLVIEDALDGPVAIVADRLQLSAAALRIDLSAKALEDYTLAEEQLLGYSLGSVSEAGVYVERAVFASNGEYYEITP